MVGVGLVISGIRGAIEPGSISAVVVNIYNCGFVLSFMAAGVTYYVLCRIWPVQILPRGVATRRARYEGEEEEEGEEEKSLRREYMVHTEGFLVDDVPLPGYIKDKMVLVGEEVVAAAAADSSPVQEVDGHLKEKF